MAILLSCLLPAGCGAGLNIGFSIGIGFDDFPDREIPGRIERIFDKPIYRNAVWGMRVVDRDTGELLYDLHSERSFLIGSVRSLFSVGVALDALGADHVFRTPVYRQGPVDAGGVLAGDLVLVASGDLSMGGRTSRDDSFAISDLDHNDANASGNAILTAPDPLAGYEALAAQVAAAGITRIAGEVVIDDRLFEPFNFRDEFDVRPIFVNDDAVDVIINPGNAGGPPTVDWRPRSAAFEVQPALAATAAGSPFEIDLAPEFPACIGTLPCVGTVGGALPADLVPPLTSQFPVIRTFRIVQPANYARTVFIEALARAGVAVDAPAVAPNPVQRLPASQSYDTGSRVAELVSFPYRDHARHILKVGYDIGADTSLVLFGVARGVTTLSAALAAEQRTLDHEFDVPVRSLHFVDGSGGGNTSATTRATTRLLTAMRRRPDFRDYFDALPRLGVDGSLAMVTDFAFDPALAGARGRVHAKPGSLVEDRAQGPVLRAQALAGYIDARSGRRLAFTLAVNEVGPVTDASDVLAVLQDQGTIAALLWNEQ